MIPIRLLSVIAKYCDAETQTKSLNSAIIKAMHMVTLDRRSLQEDYSNTSVTKCSGGHPHALEVINYDKRLRH